MDSINQDMNNMDQHPPAQNPLPQPLPVESKTESVGNAPKKDEPEEDVADAEVVIDLETEEKPAK
jgi:hypothetical protein